MCVTIFIFLCLKKVSPKRNRVPEPKFQCHPGKITRAVSIRTHKEKKKSQERKFGGFLQKHTKKSAVTSKQRTKKKKDLRSASRARGSKGLKEDAFGGKNEGKSELDGIVNLFLLSFFFVF